MTKHIVCYSGGNGSALVAIEVARRFGASDLILLNHDIAASVEHADIKRFKREIADHIGVAITYANHKDPTADQFDVTMQARAFKVGDGSELCTNRLKTAPFMAWLREHFPSPTRNAECIIYYGFGEDEPHRIMRRQVIMAKLGYATDYPLAHWDRTIESTSEIGIEPPLTYDVFKHANCIGCLKAGRQHWYVVYCTRPDVWAKAKLAEETIGYSIISGAYMRDLEPKFAAMRAAGIEATEKIQAQTFWASARRHLAIVSESTEKPCECAQ